MKRELNLLPAQRRKVLNRESFIENVANSIANVNWLLGVVALLGVAMIGLLQFFIFITAGSTIDELEQQVDRYGQLREQIAVQNNVIENMRELTNERIVWSSLIPDVLKTMSPGTSIAKMDGLAPARTIEVDGNTTSRGAVVVIRQRLLDLPWTTSVESPAENLIDRVNPDFIFKAEIAL